MLTVEELLRDCCPELTVLNTRANLSRQVFSVDSTETPDVSDYISENTMIITTGMAFRDDPGHLSEFITMLNKKPVPALAIKLERFISHIPQSVIDTADALHFPLLLIPRESTLGTISHRILSYIWNSQAKTLSGAIEINREFSRFVLRNAPVSELISHLSQMLHRSILFISPFLEVETQSILDDIDPQTVKQTLTMIRSHYLGTRCRRQHNLFHIDGKTEGDASVSVFPVAVDSHQKYLLAVFNAKKIPYPFSELVLEQVTIPIAFVQYKYQMIESGALLEKKKFFRLVSSAQNDPETFPLMLATYDSWYGLTSSNFYQAIIVGIDNLNSYEEPHQVFSIIYRWLEREALVKFPDAAVFPTDKENHLAIVLQRPVENISDLLNGLNNKLGSFLPFSLSFSIGNNVTGLDSLWFSYLKALEAYNKAAENGESHFIKQYFAQGIRDIVQLIPSDHAKHFSKYVLKELTYPKTKLNRELRQTLTVFMNNQGDLSKTAQEAYLHRNTVRYRIEKVRAILGADLDNPEVSMNIRLALLFTAEKD